MPDPDKIHIVKSGEVTRLEDKDIDVEMHLIGKEKKLLLTNEEKGYLVDIRELY